MVDRIAEIRARVEAVQAVTPGPWEHEASDTYGHLVWFVDVAPDPETNGETPMQVQEFIADHIATAATAEFVAASIEDIPFLLSRLAEYEARIAAALAIHPKAWPDDDSLCSCSVCAALSVSPEPKEGNND